ncbi:hypothetical protein [Actinopolymorpha pittospori]
MRRRRSTWLAVLAALILVSWQAQAAQAAPGPDKSARHCVAGLQALPTGASVSTAKTTELTCFSSFAQAIAYATGDRVKLAPEATTVTEKQLVGAGAVSTRSAVAARPLVGIEYEDSNYGGDSLTLYGASGTGCYSGTWYGFPSMASLGFDNRISSARTYSNCLGKHHDGTSYTGTFTYCDSSCSSLGSMGDRTSSIKFI